MWQSPDFSDGALLLSYVMLPFLTAPPIARNAPLEKSEVVFEAFTWRGAEVLTHTATYADSKFARKGGVATMIVFVESARSQFGSAGLAGQRPEQLGLLPRRPPRA